MDNKHEKIDIEKAILKCNECSKFIRGNYKECLDRTSNLKVKTYNPTIRTVISSLEATKEKLISHIERTGDRGHTGDAVQEIEEVICMLQK